MYSTNEPQCKYGVRNIENARGVKVDPGSLSFVSDKGEKREPGLVVGMEIVFSFS